MLIDVHCHLDHYLFKNDLDKVIDNAKKTNVKVILTAGINPETNRKVLEIAENIIRQAPDQWAVIQPVWPEALAEISSEVRNA